MNGSEAAEEKREARIQIKRFEDRDPGRDCDCLVGGAVACCAVSYESLVTEFCPHGNRFPCRDCQHEADEEREREEAG